MESNSEQRKYKRYKYETVIWHDNLLPDIFYRAKIFNLSKRGVYFESDQIIYPGEEIYISIKNLSASINDKKDCIRVEIKWRRELLNSPFRFGYGAKFTDPIDTLVKSIDKAGLHQLSSRIHDFKHKKDPRKHPRTPYRKIMLFTADNRNYKGFITDISRGGAFIITKNKFSLGQMIHLVIAVDGKKKDVKLKGWVVRLNPKGVGIKFDRRAGRNRRRVLDRRSNRSTITTKHHSTLGYR